MLLFGDAFERYLRASPRHRSLGEEPDHETRLWLEEDGWNPMEAYAELRGEVAGELFLEVAKAASRRYPRPSGGYGSPSWTDALVRALGDQMARARH